MVSQSSEHPEKFTFSPGPGATAGRLWFGLLGGGIAWTLHLLIVAITAEWGCLAGLHRWQMMGLTVVAWTIILVSVVMAFVALASTWVAYHAMKRLRTRPEEANDLYDRLGTRRFMAWTGLATSGFFLLIIIVQSIPILFYLTEC